MEARPPPRLLEPAALTFADATAFARAGGGLVADRAADADADARRRTSPPTRDIRSLLSGLPRSCQPSPPSWPSPQSWPSPPPSSPPSPPRSPPPTPSVARSPTFEPWPGLWYHPLSRPALQGGDLSQLLARARAAVARAEARATARRVARQYAGRLAQLRHAHQQAGTATTHAPRLPISLGRGLLFSSSLTISRSFRLSPPLMLTLTYISPTSPLHLP